MDLKQALIASLESVSQATETIYLRLGASYAALIGELDEGSEHKALQDPLFQTIQESLQVVQSQDGLFAEDQAAVGGLLSGLEVQLKALGALGIEINQIREDSILMELISLNALVIAARAGSSGRAFSCITAELKLLSNHTMALTDLISTEAQALDNVFQEFRTNLTSLSRDETEGFVSFLGRLKVLFGGVHQEALRLLAELTALQERSLEVKAPLVQIMVAMQNQDRIRQSIDHVLLSLREFETTDQTAALEAQLDELSFLEILPDLSSLVLDEVQTQLQSDRGVFQASLSTARGLIHSLEGEHKSFLENRLASKKEGGLEETFHKAQGLLESYVDETGRLVQTRSMAFRKSATLQKKTEDLQGYLRSFEPLTSRFRNIDLASRIQVARQAALSSMKPNATEMNHLTQKIELDVKNAFDITSSFFSSVGGLFETYRTRAQQRAVQDQAFLASLQATIVAMVAGKESLKKTLDESRIFTGRFIRQFSESETDLEALDQLRAQIFEQKNSLNVIKARVGEAKAQLMAEHGIKEWTIGSEKLKSMVSHFTIFTHKKFAAELGKFEVEQSVESGDVTLF